MKIYNFNLLVILTIGFVSLFQNVKGQQNALFNDSQIQFHNLNDTVKYNELLKSKQLDSNSFYDLTKSKIKLIYNDVNKGIKKYATYYDNDSISSVLTYRGDSLYGPYTYYYRNGKKSFQCRYINNKKENDGTCYSWFDNGQLNWECEYEQGRLRNVTSLYDRNGRKMYKGTIGYGNGSWIFYLEQNSSFVDFIYNFKNGIQHGPFIKFYDYTTDTLYFQTFKNGVLNGYYCEFYPNNKLSKECFYEDGKIKGAYNHYDSSGRLYYQEIYSNGQFLFDKYFPIAKPLEYDSLRFLILDSLIKQVLLKESINEIVKKYFAPETIYSFLNDTVMEEYMIEQTKRELDSLQYFGNKNLKIKTFTLFNAKIKLKKLETVDNSYVLRTNINVFYLEDVYLINCKNTNNSEYNIYVLFKNLKIFSITPLFDSIYDSNGSVIGSGLTQWFPNIF